MTWAGALAWLTVETERARRGQTLGLVFGVAVLGAIIGPMFGAVAKTISVEVTFVTVGIVVLTLASAVAAQPRARVERAVKGRPRGSAR